MLRSAVAVSLFVVLQSPADEKMIRAVRDQSNAAIARHDLDGIAAAWMDDVHVVSSTSAQTAGKKANRERMAAQFKNPDTPTYAGPSRSRFMRRGAWLLSGVVDGKVVRT